MRGHRQMPWISALLLTDSNTLGFCKIESRNIFELHSLPAKDVIQSANWTLVTHVLDYVVPSVTLQCTNLALGAPKVPPDITQEPMLATAVGLQGLARRERLATHFAWPHRE